MFIRLITIAILLVVVPISSIYNGYKVVKMNLKTDQEMDTVLQLSEKYQLDIWAGPSKVLATEVMISPQKLSSFLDSLKEHGIEFKIEITDVQETLDKETNSSMNKRNMPRWKNIHPIVTDHFATYDEIMQWTDYLKNRYYFVSKHIYGWTYEGRRLICVKISTGSNRKAIIIDAGIHAREWLGISTLNFILEKIIQEFINQNCKIFEILSKYDLYFIPVFNPDGYAFSHTKGNRFWRKNKKPFYENGKRSYGVDLNRNFDINFGCKGRNSNKSSDVYCGPYAFSELETAQFTKLVEALGSRIKLYLSLHAYSQLWIVPYSYTMTPPSDDYEMRRVANIGAKALYDVNKESYKVGSAGELIYLASGSSMDWMKLKAGVKYAYGIEVRPTIESPLKFAPPITYIKLTGEEVYAGFIATIQAMQI